MDAKVESSAPSRMTRWVDPVIEAYKPGIDRTIIRHNLTLTFEQRIVGLKNLMDSIEQMQKMGREARARK